MAFHKTFIIIVVSLSLLAFKGLAQNKIGNNPTVINSSAAFEIESSNGGLLLPRIALSNVNSASPLNAHVAGMIVYNTSNNPTNGLVPGYYCNDGTQWLRGITPTPSTLYSGNGSLSANRVVTQGSFSLTFAGTGNLLKPEGRIGIGTAVPSRSLVVENAGNAFEQARFVNTGTDATNANSNASVTIASTIRNAGLNILGGDVNSATIVFGKTSTGSAAGVIRYLNNTDAMSFGTSTGVIAMTISNNQNIGIGTSTPDEKLSLFSANAAPLAMKIQNSQGFARLAVAGVANDFGLPNPGDVVLQNSIGAGLALGNSQNSIQLYVNSAGNVGVGTTTPLAQLDVSGTGALKVPVGTTAERPATPAMGMIRFNSTTNKYEGYNGTVWIEL